MDISIALELVSAGTMTNKALFVLARESGDQRVWDAVAKKLNFDGLTVGEIFALSQQAYNIKVLEAIAERLSHEDLSADQGRISQFVRLFHRTSIQPSRKGH